MNVQEHEKLTSFLQQLAQAQVGTRDFEAEKLIQETCGRQPEACYLLVQRCFLLDQAVQNAQAEVARLKREQESQRAATTGGFFDSNAWGNTPATPAIERQAAAPAVAAPPASSSFFNPGLLGTVAGVVAGSFLFQGIEKMIGNHDNTSSPLADSSLPKPPPPSESALAESHGISASNNIDDLDALGLPDGDPDFI